MQSELDFDLPKGIRGQTSAKGMLIPGILKVLVTDDDRDSCVIQPFAENLGIRSDWVLTGRECINRVCLAHRSGEDYDVCLIDLRMPDMDGVPVTRRIREIVGSEPLVVIITAYDWGAVENSARQARANAFITKPIFASTFPMIRCFRDRNRSRPCGRREERHGEPAWQGITCCWWKTMGLTGKSRWNCCTWLISRWNARSMAGRQWSGFSSHGDSFDLMRWMYRCR